MTLFCLDGNDEHDTFLIRWQPWWLFFCLGDNMIMTISCLDDDDDDDSKENDDNTFLFRLWWHFSVYMSMMTHFCLDDNDDNDYFLFRWQWWQHVSV